MNIGALIVKLHIPENQSLKGKRKIVKSIVAQVHNKFNVSIAEVDDQDLWQSAIIGVACVSNDARHVNEVLSHVISFIGQVRGDAEICDYEIEILHAL